MNLIGTVAAETTWTALCTGCSFVSGYVYGAIANSDRMLFAKVNAISQLAQNILEASNRLITGGNAGNYKTIYLFNDLVINTSVCVIEIVALRRFNLIATTGTVVLGTLSSLGGLISLMALAESINN